MKVEVLGIVVVAYALVFALLATRRLAAFPAAGIVVLISWVAVAAMRGMD